MRIENLVVNCTAHHQIRFLIRHSLRNSNKVSKNIPIQLLLYNQPKPGEIQKDYYVRTLFHLYNPTDIISMISADSFKEESSSYH